MLLFSDYCLFIEVPGDRGYYNHLVEVGEGAWATQSFATFQSPGILYTSAHELFNQERPKSDLPGVNFDLSFLTSCPEM